MCWHGVYVAFIWRVFVVVVVVTAPPCRMSNRCLCLLGLRLPTSQACAIRVLRPSTLERAHVPVQSCVAYTRIPDRACCRQKQDMADADSTFEIVEREIRRAEALLKQNPLAVDGDPDWTPSKGRKVPNRPRLPEERRKEVLNQLRKERSARETAGDPVLEEEEPLELDDSKLESFILTGGVNTSHVLTPDSKNRYKDRDARDALINKLLAERKHTKTVDTNSEGSEKSAPGTLASRVADIANESVQHQTTPLVETPSGRGASSIRVKRSGSVVIKFDGTSDEQDPDAPTTRKSTAKKKVGTPKSHSGTRPGSSARTKRDPDQTHLNESFLDTSFKHSDKRDHDRNQMMPYSYGNDNFNPERPKPTVSASKPRRQKKPSQEDVGKTARYSTKTYSSAPSRPFARKTKEDVEREAEEKRKRECTFQPKINPINETSKIGRETREQRLARLASDRTAKLAKREQDRIARERAEVDSKCTFKPRTNDAYVTRKNGVVNWSRVDEARGRVPLQERLFHEADTRVTSRESLKRQLEEAEMSSFPFKPSINPRSNAILNMHAYKPIHERIEDLQKARRTGLQKQRLQHEQNDPDLTFQPKISLQSRQLVESRRLASSEDPQEKTANDVTKRLVLDAEEKVGRTMSRKRAWEEKQKQVYTFQPRVNDTSRAIVANNGGDDQSFLERQAAMAERAMARERRARLKAMKDNECTFKPNIGNATAVLQHTRPSLLRESDNERVERLSVQDRVANDKRKQAAEDAYYKQFTHKPRIDAISSSLARAKTVDELTSTDRINQKKEKLSQRREQELATKCPFEPSLVESRVATAMRNRVSGDSSRVSASDPSTIIEKINRQKRRKELKIEEIRHRRQYEEGQTCSFQPVLNRSKPKQSKGPIQVKGFGRFLELKELAKKIEDEKATREERAFKVTNVKEYRRGNVTVAKPFKLSGQNREENMKKLTEKLRRQEMKECTFVPSTTETQNRKLLTEILADDSELDFEAVDSMLDTFDEEIVC